VSRLGRQGREANGPLENARGMTLIELMVTVGILAILAAVAIPLYQNFLKKAKAVEAESILKDIERLEEVYFIETGTYSNNLSAIGYAPTVQPVYFQQSRITVGTGRATPGGRRSQIQYQVIVKGNLDADRELDAWVLTKYLSETSDIYHGCIPSGRGWAIQFTCND
jgi:prepilin-type N-terminal cleavage/methylation domain-containing protein